MNENMNRTEVVKPICILPILNTSAGQLYSAMHHMIGWHRQARMAASA